VRYRGDWDGRGAGGAPPGPVRAGPRGGGDNDGWRPRSPPLPPLCAPLRPIRGPPFSLNHFGGSAGRPPACGTRGPPRLPPLPSRVRAYRFAVFHACRGLRRRVLPQARQEVRPTSGAAAKTTARAARRASRGAHSLSCYGATGARKVATAATARGPCPAVRRAPLRVGGGLPPARRRETTKSHPGRFHGRRLFGTCLIPRRPGRSTSTEIRATRRSCSGC